MSLRNSKIGLWSVNGGALPIEIYIGAPVEVESERILLESLVQCLGTAARDAVLFANITLSGRQIDMVLSTEGLALVIEAKGYRTPVRGLRNGDWQVRVATGDWKNTGNAYIQARDGGLVLRDSIRSFDRGSSPGYPAAAVVFVPDIPTGSDCSVGDFKVSVIGLPDLPSLLNKKQGVGWTLDKWRAFAQHHRFTKVSMPSAAYDQELLNAEKLLVGYKELFLQTYQETELVPVTCHLSDTECSSDSLVNEVVEQGMDVLILGPSGCGKSSIAVQSAINFCQVGMPLVVSASEFRGNLKELLQRETALLSNVSAAVLLKSARRLCLPILILIDGYNECPAEFRGLLSRSIAAIARMCEARVVVTSQVALERANLLCLTTVRVDLPTDDVKAKIAGSVCQGALDPELEILAKAVSTSLEARLVGELDRERPVGSSRFAIFDAFARKRLGSSTREGIEFLVCIASWLSERVSFSISERDFDRLATAEKTPINVTNSLLKCGLLRKRGDRLMFPHEMFLNTFAAEAIIRKSIGNAGEIIAAMADPRNAGRREFLVGTIDDVVLLEEVLNGIVHEDTAMSCLLGACGRRAKEWAENFCKQMFQRVRNETRKLRFKLSADGWDGVCVDSTSVEAWSDLDNAFLRAIPEMLHRGHYVSEVLSIVRLMDERLLDQHRRLSDEARKRKTPLRSALFATTYVFGGGNQSHAVGKICAVRGGARVDSPQMCTLVEEQLERPDLTPGEIVLLLNLSQNLSDAGKSLAPRLVSLIPRVWAQAPYHLRLDLLQAAERCRFAHEKDRIALIEILNKLETKHIGISSTIIDALQILGALEEFEQSHEVEVRNEVEFVLTNLQDPFASKKALHLYYRQFDHPYSGAYAEVIHELCDSERKQLFTLALIGADGDSNMFVSSLISDLAEFGDSTSGAYIVPFTRVPPPDSSGSQEAMEVFVEAHIALARLVYPLPAVEIISDRSVSSVAACGRILYWCNRLDLTQEMRFANCEDSLEILMEHESGTALDAIRVCDQWFLQDEGRRRDTQIQRYVTDCFPTEVLEISRHALQAGIEQRRFFHRQFDYDKNKPIEFAIGVLKKYGNSVDLMLLRRYVSHPHLGSIAISAVKSIEERM